jgi:hypothetical protein
MVAYRFGGHCHGEAPKRSGCLGKADIALSDQHHLNVSKYMEDFGK